MPRWSDSEGRYLAQLSDYLTATPPAGHWGWSMGYGMQVIQSTYPWWTAGYMRADFGPTDPPLVRDLPEMQEVWGNGWGQHDYGCSSVLYYPQYDTVTDINVAIGLAASRIYDVTGSTVSWRDDHSYAWGPSRASNGPRMRPQYLDMHRDDWTASITSDVNAVKDCWRKGTGTAPWYRDLQPDAHEATRQRIQQGVAEHGWRWLIPGTGKKVRPLPNFGGSGGGVMTSKDGDDKMVTILGGCWIPRVGEACAWIKELQTPDLRNTPNPLKAWRPALWTGGASGTSTQEISVSLRNVSGSYTTKYHFATVDGSESPATEAAAGPMCGLSGGGDWAVYGVAGLRATDWQGTRTWWFGRGPYAPHPSWGNKPIRLTAVLVPAGYAPIGVTTLDGLLAGGCKVGGQWELYPLSEDGPALPLNVSVERLTVDLSLHGGIRLGTSAGVGPGGYDGGEITV